MPQVPQSLFVCSEISNDHLEDQHIQMQFVKLLLHLVSHQPFSLLANSLKFHMHTEQSEKVIHWNSCLIRIWLVLFEEPSSFAN